MTRPTSPADVARAVPAGVGRLIAGGLDESQRAELIEQLALLYAEHTDVRHPLAPDDTPLRTRDDLRRHFAGGPGRTVGAERCEPVGLQVYRTADPEVVAVEFRYEGSVRGRPFSLPCIFVMRVRDGEIVESRDYGDRAAVVRAFGPAGEAAEERAG